MSFDGAIVGLMVMIAALFGPVIWRELRKPSPPREFSTIFQAGGVEAAVSSNFDVDAELSREKRYAFVRLGRELEEAGFITFSTKWRSGDYTKQMLTLRFPQ